MASIPAAAHPLETTIHREEKRYLICIWALQLVQLIEGGEALNERATQSLRIARTYADEALGARIDQLLREAGNEEGLHAEDEIVGRPSPTDDDLFGDDDEDLEYEDDDVVFPDDEPAPPSGLFEQEDDVGVDSKRLDTPSLDLDQEETPGFIPSKGERKESKIGKRDQESDLFPEEEETPGFVPSKGERKESKIGKRDQESDLFPEEEEGSDADLLHNNLEDQAADDPREGDVFDTGDPTELFAEEDDAEKGASTDGVPLSEEQMDPAETAEPESGEQPEAVATKGKQKKSTVGKRPKSDPDNELEDRDPDNEDAQPTAEQAEEGEGEPSADAPDENPEEKRKEQLKAQAKQSRKTSAQRALDRKKRAKERFEQRKKQREESEAEGGEQAGEEQLFSLEDQLAKIAHIVTVDRLEEKLGAQVIPEDRLRLERQLAKKLREAPIRSLLDRAQEQNLSLVLVPRLNRLIRDGQLLKITGANILRSYPQFFENVQQVALKLRTEAHFLQESPSVGWAITTAEVLPSSRNTSYIQQKQLLKQHAQSHQTNEMQVRRRTLIEALYDLIVTKVVTGTDLLSTTADLTESSLGRQNMVFINVGENGIRISDIGRQQTHPQLGVCPNW